jgi:peptidoglycan/xylan/chitin deacetylase (PgdA/CDA1 family)
MNRLGCRPARPLGVPRRTRGYNIFTSMNRPIKRAAQALFHYAGGTWWIRRRLRHAIRILMYHRFPRVSRFEKQCAHLRKHYRPVSLTEAAARLCDGEPISERLVVVTVDDGYRDFLENAFPVLNRYDIPATVFLTTDLPDRKSWLWVDRVTYCIRQSRVREIALSIGGQERWVLDSEERRAQAAVLIKEAMKRIPDQDRLECLEKLPRLLEVELPREPPESHAPLQWDDVRALAGRGVDFGAHTRTHPILSRLAAREELEAEIGGSKRRIEQEAGIEVRHFCYPNGGRADFTQTAIDVVRDSGFSTAVTGNPGVNRAGANLFELSRIAVEPHDDDLRFARIVAGYRL